MRWSSVISDIKNISLQSRKKMSEDVCVVGFNQKNEMY